MNEQNPKAFRTNKKTLERDFIKTACRWADASAYHTGTKWWEAFKETIIGEMFYYGTVYIPGIGTFTSKYMKNGKQKQIDQYGVEHIYIVPERVIPVFTPEDDFINDINMHGVTKLYRARERKDQLTERDTIREMRAEVYQLKEEGHISEMQDKKQALMNEKKHRKKKRSTNKTKSNTNSTTTKSSSSTSKKKRGSDD